MFAANAHQVYLSGRYCRELVTSSSVTELGIPKLRSTILAIQVIGRHRKLRSIFEETVEGVLWRLSTGRINDISKILRNSGPPN